ncbi:unnamed protein product, partial [Polarella glacialis]
MREQQQPGSDEPWAERILADLRAQGPRALKAFQTALAEGDQPLRSVKLCFVGHARAGKTSTLLALAGRAFDPEQPSTHGVDTFTLANELLSSGPAVAASGEAADPWRVLEGAGSVAELLEDTVARTVAEKMKAFSPEADSGTADSACHTCKPQGAAVLKMPVDLIAQAFSTDGETEAATPVVMQTWDFAGQEMYYNMAHVFLTALGLYVLVLDLSAWAPDAPPSRELLDSLDFWLAALLVHAPDARLVIVGSHIDTIPEPLRREVYTRVDGHLARRLGAMPSLHARLHANEVAQLLFFPVDNTRSTPEGRLTVECLRKALNELALSSVASLGRIPTRWAHFFNVLAANRSGPYIALEECARIAESLCLNVEMGELEPCLALFHRLGQLLYFKGSPAVVLDPQWLLDAMAQVVACPKVLQQHSHLAMVLRQRGELSSELLGVLWHDLRFRGHTETLQAFLEQFDLLVPGAEGQAEWLVPSLLPRRSKEASYSKEDRNPEATLLLDFHGALQRLLPTLLLRLIGQLRRQADSKLRVFTVFQDFIALSVGSPPIMVTLDMFPTAFPEVVRVCASGTAGRKLEPAPLKELLCALRQAMAAWLPNVSFSACIPCPSCCASATEEFSASSVRGRHLLDLGEVLGEELLFCSEAQVLLDEGQLPNFFRAWRQSEQQEQQQQQQQPPTTTSSNNNNLHRASSDGSWTMSSEGGGQQQQQQQQQQYFLYANPLAMGSHRLRQLDV